MSGYNLTYYYVLARL